MNIALFTDCYLPSKNGVVTVVNQLYESLKKLGHHVVIVTVKSDTPYDDNNPDIFRVPSTKAGLGMKDQFLGFPILTSVSRFLKKNKIQLIHVHSEFSIGIHSFHEARKVKVPVICTTHTMWEDYYEFYLPGGKFIPVEVIRKTMRLFYKNFDALINVSTKAHEYFKKDFMVPEIPSAVIPNAINPKNYCTTLSTPEEIKELRDSLGVKENEVMLTFVGRVVEEKRIFELIDIVEGVVKKCSNAKVVFVGDGPALKHAKTLVEAKKMDKNVVFTGFINWENVHRYYEAGDIYISASLSEMHSMTVLEAMTSGLPIVVRKDSSYFDTVIPGYNGFLSDTDESMTEDLITLVNDSEMRKRYSENSKKHSVNYLPDTFAKRHEAFYQTVLANWKYKQEITDEKLAEAVEKASAKRD